MSSSLFMECRATRWEFSDPGRYYPKAFVKSLDNLNELQVVATPDELAFPGAPSWADSSTLVLEPIEDSFDHLVLGKDYESAVMSLSGGRSYVLSRKMDPPVLTHLGDLEFSWTAPPGERSLVYRAEVAVGSQATPEDFKYVALSAPSVAGEKSSYTDRFSNDFTSFRYSYLVITSTGTSNTVLLTSPF